ncbi:MAG: tRNA (adenosine(37)-N6)-threonylcarbamoyltransferase complex ATPase subunit type 1 TsaE [Deltaproteobacteria bacterium]|nr:tRNA (adenosine(37)-N6)-threonylcarbamoyltransferase complex ATPase subunit type 1 TsaE [Deltaproteobacteria bacterium]
MGTCLAKQKSVTLRSSSAPDTIGLGKKLGSLLKEGDVIGLVGELGTGKTWLTKGLAVGLGVKSENLVTSPSFTLVNVYEGRIPVYHMDAYRLQDLSDFLAAGLEEYFYMGGVAVLEWADRWPEILPPHHVRVELAFVDEKQRDITFSGFHSRAVEIIKQMEGGPQGCRHGFDCTKIRRDECC